jgi:hypothetical protein
MREDLRDRPSSTALTKNMSELVVIGNVLMSEKSQSRTRL